MITNPIPLKVAQLRERYRSTKTWLNNNYAKLSVMAFVGGFGIDLLTLTRTDELLDNLILLTYLAIAAIAIMLTAWENTDSISCEWVKRMALASPFVMQFAFGGLLSGFVIFYTKSASLYTAWPFLIVLYLFFISNERLQMQYRKLGFQVGVFYAGLFAYCILAVPTLLGTVTAGSFITSGIVSLVIIVIYLEFLFKMTPLLESFRMARLAGQVVIIFVIFNLLYFARVIPPIPLVLKDSGVYHTLERLGATYRVTDEKYNWYNIGSYFGTTFHKANEQETVYVYTAIFAPTKFKANVVHNWQWYNPTSEKWQSVSKPKHLLKGGRDAGFRWYSFVENPTNGRWRVLVETSEGREIGRTNFSVTTENSDWFELVEKII